MKAPSITVIGTGEAFGTQFGNTSYLLQGVSAPSILFDCGYQIPERLWKSGLDKKLDAVCFTHLHADHCFGIVPLLTRYWEEKRTRPLTILGSRGTEIFIKKLFTLGYPGIFSQLKFPIRFVSLSESNSISFEGLSLSVARTVHSVLNYTIRVDFERNRFKSFALSGDGQITPSTQELVKDVGLLLQEVYTLRKKIPVHADLKTLEAWASGASISKIGVAHHARSEVNRVHKRIQVLARKDPRWFVLKPGQIISLKD